MKKLALTTALAVSVALFSACNPLSLLPPIEVPDALGTEGQEMVSEVVAYDLRTVSSQKVAAKATAVFDLQTSGQYLVARNRVSGQVYAVMDKSEVDARLTMDPIIDFSVFSKTLTFDDPKDLPAIPDKLTAQLKSARASFSGAACTGLPKVIKGKYSGLSLTISDAKGAATVTPSATQGRVIINGDGGSNSFVSFYPELSFSATGLATVLGNGTNPNSAEISMAVVYDDGFKFPAGCTVTLTMNAARGSYSF